MPEPVTPDPNKTFHTDPAVLSALFARRYLFSKKSRSVINIISGVSVAAVAMPAAAMIILLSVFNGFEHLVRSMASAFDADLTVTVHEGSAFPTEALDTAAMRRIPGVKALSYVVEQNAMLEYGSRQAAAKVRGVDEAYADVVPIVGAVTTGEYSVRLGDYDRMVMGQGMAYALGIRILNERDLTIYALRRGSFSTLLPLDGYSRRKVPVAGLFLLDAQTEKEYVLTSLRLARELFDYPDGATALLLSLDGSRPEEEVKMAVASVAGDTFRVRNRYEMKPSFYDIMTYEKWGIFFISLLVLVIASFSIVGSLVMLVIEKQTDIRTLVALGADRRLIRRIFVGEGLLIGALGGCIGVVLGVGCTLVQQHFGVIRIPVETFITQSYPVEFRWGDLLIVVAVFAGVTAAVSQLTVGSMIRNEKEKI